MDEAASEPVPAAMPTRRRRLPGRIAKWTLGLVAALVLAIIGAALVLNTPLGERFIAERIAKRTFPNGLNIRIGRIEGNLYGAAVLHDVVLSDPKGAFLTIPRAEVDWNPRAWLSNRLDIDSFAARRARLARVPEFLPSEEDNPILPGFDISIDRLTIDNLMLAAGVAGPRPQRLDLDAEVQVADKRLKLDAKGAFGRRDRFDILLDAEPDGNRFALQGAVVASESGAIAGLTGFARPWSGRVRGTGGWRDWRGALVARSEGERLAALQITNRSGRFGVLGKLDPSGFTQGTLARALWNDVAVKIDTRFAARVLDGSAIVLGRGIDARAQGKLDLAQNRADNLRIRGFLRDPALLGPDLRFENARIEGLANGPLDALMLAHRITVGRLVAGTTQIDGLVQAGTARRVGGRWTLPLDLAAQRVRTGNALIDPRLVNGRGRGELVLAGNALTGDALRLVFPGAEATLSLRGDLAAGRYEIAGPVRASGLRLENVGTAGGTAMIRALFAKGAPLRLGADLDARIAPVSNATLANLAGPSIRVRGGIALGDGPLRFSRVRVLAAKLDATLDGSVRDGSTRVAGRGRHSDYGPFTVEATLAKAGPRAVLVFAKPYDGLENVRVALAPRGDGFVIDTEGQSTLGPFVGTLGLVAPRGGDVRIAIDRLTVSDTAVTGALALRGGVADGTLGFAGGGVTGTLVLRPQGGGQGLAVDLTARNARFGGATPLSIAQAQLRGEGLLRKGSSTFSGSGTAQGLSWGNLFIGRLAARGEVTDGRGRIDAALSGRRGARFDLDVNALIAPEQVAVAARGEFAGKPVTMPRRAVLTRLPQGGWALAPSQLVYGGGGVVAEGRFGGGETALDLKLAQMPLSLADLAIRDLGLGGSISGVIEYRQPRGGLPAGTARVKVDGLTRSGLVLTSRPVDLSLVARLTADRLETRAVLRNEDIRRGRLQARITGLPGAGTLGERLRAGRLFAQLRYQGAAESLWRLAAIDAFDLTGPVAVAADATGTLADPVVQGLVSSDALKVQSSLSGTVVSDVALRGRFVGSRLQLSRFAGKTANGGTISGSGLVDLKGLGERVEGRFVEIRGPTLDLKLAAANARLVNARGLSATVSGPLRIVSNGLGGTIAGRVRIDRASWKLGTAADDRRLPRISTREINVPADRMPTAASSRPWRYLIDAAGSSRIEVDGMGLESEWGASIRLRGTTEEPLIAGKAELVRGDYSFAGTSFEMTRGEIRFDDTGPVDPTLDIRAETQTNSLSVAVTVRGRASQPEIAFSSVPSLPEEEILARLLFGGSITSLSATDALQLGSALASLRGGGGLDPINRLRTAIGLDRLRIVSADPALNRGTGIALGKNIGRKFYVEIVTDGRGYSATELEFRVTSWLSLLATVSTVGRDSAVAEIRRDY